MHNLNQARKRIGRGQGSGQGVQAGKGHKGQKARKSGNVRIGFEGGQMPIYMRLPKRGFKNVKFKEIFAIVNLGQLERKYLNNEEVTRETLSTKGLIKGANRKLPIKILTKGSLSKPLVFKGIEKFSETARALINKVGGQVITAN